MNKKLLLLFIILTSDFSAQILIDKNLDEGILFISKYISSEEYSQIRQSTSDLSSIDTLFLRSITFYNYDFNEALLALTFATLPYSEMPLAIPIVNSTMNIPLPTPKELMSAKNKNLPSHFLTDSPINDFGDKDKLAHFFGNAYLSYSFPLFNFSDFLSIFVEKFEEAFKVEGAFDRRDIMVNIIGKKFGEELRRNSEALPSQILSKY